jgi:hypothetical protein
MRATDTRVVAVSASKESSAAELLQPLAELMETDFSGLTPETVEQLEGHTVLAIDQAEQLTETGWLVEFQDFLRALFTAEASRGRLRLLIAARPLFRDALGGRGSPLANAAAVTSVRPLTVSEIESAMRISRVPAQAIHAKTGGHPYLTEALVQATNGQLDELRRRLEAFCADNRRYIVGLVDDLGMRGRRVLTDLLATGKPVSRTALIRRHFQDQRSAFECIDDLVGSGFVSESDECLEISAGLLSKLRRGLPAPAEYLERLSPDRHLEAASLLYAAENELRELIARLLAAVDTHWWPDRIPSEVAAKAASRRAAENESRAPSDRELHPLYYVDLAELFEIIVFGENWSEVFSVGLREDSPTGQQALLAIQSDLLLIRNKVAHNRPVSSSDLDVLTQGVSQLGLRVPVAAS